MPLEKGMRATVSKRDSVVEPGVDSASAGGDVSIEEKGMAVLSGGPGPTRISLVPLGWSLKTKMYLMAKYLWQ